jgi:type I restriction enzyme R subunit
LTWFQDTGWEYRYGPDLAPEGETSERNDYRQILLTGRLLEALRRLNPNIPEQTLEEDLSRIAKPDHPSLILNNRSFHEALLDSLPVEVEQAGEKRGDRVRLIDLKRRGETAIW